MKPLSIENIRVQADRIVVQLTCGPAWRMTNAALVKAVCNERPLLPHHTCVNGLGPTFDAVMENTPLPHLFEHVVVDLLTEQHAREHVSFVGTSEWIDEARGQARVEFSFTDDLEALAAIQQAEKLLNAIIMTA